MAQANLKQNGNICLATAFGALAAPGAGHSACFRFFAMLVRILIFTASTARENAMAKYT